MDTYVELFCGGMVPLREFVNRKQDRDILVRVIVKKRAGCFAYLSVRNQIVTLSCLDVLRLA